MDTYQAVYDATRSKLGNCDVAGAIERVAWEHFDISHQRAMVADAFMVAAASIERPSVLYRPQLMADGTAWCALLGDNLQEGVAGFGDTPAEAMAAFDQAFWKERTPAANRTPPAPTPSPILLEEGE